LFISVTDLEISAKFPTFYFKLLEFMDNKYFYNWLTAHTLLSMRNPNHELSWSSNHNGWEIILKNRWKWRELWRYNVLPLSPLINRSMKRERNSFGQFRALLHFEKRYSIHTVLP